MPMVILANGTDSSPGTSSPTRPTAVRRKTAYTILNPRSSKRSVCRFSGSASK